ncbi:hypothetical protein EG68_00988 [Paragonimus skrjabini miyazakii]|uniref:Uncharacterized protein n=1 Tax=Paragonimus skrjabini miyazakii TaxID=59628 RepID=A0A8S9ZCE6_9TREM|nr:hypothetical protein EG68_00988 [Paragonimus skrjabini miyazakii]
MFSVRLWSLTQISRAVGKIEQNLTALLIDGPCWYSKSNEQLCFALSNSIWCAKQTEMPLSGPILTVSYQTSITLTTISRAFLIDNSSDLISL